jgi:hypothetical protein
MMLHMSELTEEQEKTGRIFLRLPPESIKEIDTYIGRSGVGRSHFLAMSMMLGARGLDRALYPQGAYTPVMVEQMSAALVKEFGKMDAEALDRFFASVPAEK